MMWKLITTTVLLAVSSYSSRVMSADSVHPPMLRAGVVFAEGESLKGLRPIFAVPVGESILFSHAEPGNSCEGKGLWRWQLRQRELAMITLSRQSVAAPDLCVEALEAKGEEIYVHHRWQGRREIDLLKGDELIPMRGGKLSFKGSGNWNFNQRVLLASGDETASADWLDVSILPGAEIQVALERKGDSGEIAVLSVGLGERQRESRRGLTPLFKKPAGYHARAKFLSNTQLLVILQSDQDESLVRLQLWGRGEKVWERTAELGHDLPYIRSERWSQRGIDVWSSRRIGVATAVQGGLFFAETTTRLNEKAGLSFLPLPPTEQFPVLRVSELNADWASQLSSVFPWKDGLIISYKNPAMLAYVGPKNPFPESEYESRRPDFEPLSEKEYELIVKGVDHEEAK